MAWFVFWLSVGLLAWTWGGYLVGLVSLDALRELRANARWLSRSTDRRRTEGNLPRVSVLIAAHDEAAVIREKLENTLTLDYPADRLQVLVGSDGSTDATDAIVAEFAERGVVLSAAMRGGKASVLQRLSRIATGDVWLFTDANTMIAPDALRRLVRHFDDPDVGGVSGRLRLVTPEGGAAEEGAYWRYENLLKLYESRLGVLVGANGGIYALRRTEWKPLMPDTIVDDFVVTMRVLLSGHRLVYDPSAIAVEETASSLEGEFRRRVRIAAGNFQSLRDVGALLWQPSRVAVAFWSHKMIRWLGPLWLAGAFVSSAALARDPFYVIAFAVQVAVYALAAASRVTERGVPRVARTAQYLVEMHVALALGLARHLRGTQAAAWQRTARGREAA